MKSLPFGVGQLLGGAIARVRRLRLIRGLAGAGLVWIFGTAVLMAIDSRIVILDDRLRLALTALVCLLTLSAIVFGVVRPFCRTISFRKMAAILDARHPEHEERLMTLVELLETDAANVGFSASLFARVCDLAVCDAAKIDLAREFPLRRTLGWLVAFLALALALGISVAASPDLVGRLFVRAIAPWSDVGNVFADTIAVTPGDLVILSGKVIRIEAVPTSALSTADHQKAPCTIRISRKTRHGWSEETSEPMVNGVYETTADLNERAWRYRVTAGPAVTRYYHVRVSEMPKYESFRATVRYPDYTGLKPLVISNDAITAIRAVAGSRVTFDVKVCDPGTIVDFRIGQEPITEYLMVSNRTASGSLDLVNADGFRAEKGRFTLTSFIDQPPTVVLEKPTGTLSLPSHAKIPVEITATDDLAITSAYLRVSVDRAPWKPLDKGRFELNGDRRFVRPVADVDLSLHNFVFARSVRFDVVVDDACPPAFGGPHAATSMPFTVQFAEQASSYRMTELQKEVSSARQTIDEALRRLNDANRLARQVRDELRRSAKPTENTERNSERLAHELDEAAKRVGELRNRFFEDERFAPLTRPLDRLLNEALKPALERVEKSSFREKDARADEVDKAIPEMEKAVQELKAFKARLAERAEKVDQFEKAKDLAARQEALAKAAKAIVDERPSDTAKFEAWRRLEEAAMRKAEELARQKPDLELAEARRKMETASREMAGLKGELEDARAKARDKSAEAVKRAEAQAAQKFKQKTDREERELTRAVQDQARAAEALKQAEGRRADEAKLRTAKNAAAADQKAREAENFERQAAEAQRTAEDRMERGAACEGVKALQQQASQATRDARQAPQTAAKSAAARHAQQTALEALQQELAVRARIRKNEQTPEDLDWLEARKSKASSPVQAAADASDAMAREVKAQAAALGMRAGQTSGKDPGERDEAGRASNGGDVSDEVQDLARDLKRRDRPDFFKELFSRFGWFKIRGTSKGGIRESDLKDVPLEYRDLVRRYFLKLSEEQPGQP